MELISRFISGNGDIFLLDLSYNMLNGKSLEPLLRLGMKTNTSIGILNLSNNGLTWECAKLICEQLSDHISLTVL